MDQNKTGKYFKYAIGEIVLVVIGILIALSINNWNEARKIRAIEQTLLKDLKIELTSNLSELGEVIFEHEKSLKAAQELLAYSRKPRELDKIPDSTVQRMISTMNKNWTYNPQKGILNSITSSGQLSYIGNKELRYLLASIQDITGDVLESTNQIENNKAALLNPAFKNGFIIESGKMLGYNVKGALQVPEFWMATSGLFVDNRTYGIEEENNLKVMIAKMLNLIDKEIKYD
jgi:hypothetical protein